MTESQCLEPAPLAEIVRSAIDAKYQVLVADAILTLAVYSWLVGSYHTRNQWLAVEVLADILRTFVDVEIESYSVTGPMAEIALRGP